LVVLVVWGASGLAVTQQQYVQRTQKKLDTVVDLARYFPKSVDEIAAYTKYAIESARKVTLDIIAIPTQKRTFTNTMRAYDNAFERFHRITRIALLYSMVVPDDALRKAAYKAYVQLTQAATGLWESGAINQAFKDYVEHRAVHEDLSREERYFIDEIMADYDHVGLNLPLDGQAALRLLKNDILRLKFSFRHNIALDKRFILATRDELQGVSESFIDSLAMQDDRYVVTTDYPSYHAVMSGCRVAATRERLYLGFMNRAYPKNEPILEHLLDLRNQLAYKLGSTDYATWALQTETARTPEYVGMFIKSLAQRAAQKTTREYEELKENLPDGITLDADGRIKPWDYPYVLARYKKKYNQFSMRSIAPYFSLPTVLKGMFTVFGRFLGLVFTEVKPTWTWHPEVKLIQVQDDQTKELKGYIFLDLHPRPKKYTHAMHATLVIPIGYANKGSVEPSVAAIVANICRPSGDKPAFLNLHGVKALFHEFGHAIHAMLSRPQMAYFSGTRVKRDFVEVPSQFFAFWLTDPTILKTVGRHYRTNKPIPQSLVDRILEVRCWDSGYRTTRSCWLALMSLRFHTEGLTRGVDALTRSLHDELIDSVSYDPRAHMQESFGHLGSRGAKYYGYLWAQVMAQDLFAMAQKEGLLDRKAGQRFVSMILQPGGSEDPVRLVTKYLGRKSTLGAFTRALALR
jgi:Zn-dependent oligopeptidase